VRARAKKGSSLVDRSPDDDDDRWRRPTDAPLLCVPPAVAPAVLLSSSGGAQSWRAPLARTRTHSLASRSACHQ
jgi:hypothetical protein